MTPRQRILRCVVVSCLPAPLPPTPSPSRRGRSSGCFSSPCRTVLPSVCWPAMGTSPLSSLGKGLSRLTPHLHFCIGRGPFPPSEPLPQPTPAGGPPSQSCHPCWTLTQAKPTPMGLDSCNPTAPGEMTQAVAYDEYLHSHDLIPSPIPSISGGYSSHLQVRTLSPREGKGRAVGRAEL